MSEILVFPRSACRLFIQALTREYKQGEAPSGAFWRERAAAEADEGTLQLVPYGLVCDPAGKVWCYRRLGGGEKRLSGRASCGVGGHVEREDGTGNDAAFHAMAQACLLREIHEEIAWPAGESPIQELRPLLWIYDGSSPVGRVHLGLVFRVAWRAPQPPEPARGEAIEALGFQSPEHVAGDPAFESWSRIAAGAWVERAPSKGKRG